MKSAPVPAGVSAAGTVKIGLAAECVDGACLVIGDGLLTELGAKREVEDLDLVIGMGSGSDFDAPYEMPSTKRARSRSG
jgi:hypothetical protein